ncbi:ABC transporter permease [Conexibacter woesei]|uniref:ABC transporter permease n=1 Tax=Conexibacter woesei TaxID=191495 RepID=UPI0002FB4C6A|nr:ABC transporter permease [Conexibacter woesei]
MLVFAFLAVTEPIFLTWDNWQNIIRTQSATLAIALGMTVVVISGGIDLSAGSIAAAAGMMLGLTVQAGWSWPMGVLAAIALGVAMGGVNGLLIGRLRVPFFVVTLGTMSVYQSEALLSSGGDTVSLFETASFMSLADLVNGNVGPIPTVGLIVMAMAVAMSLLLRRSTFGRSVFAVGSNEDAARLNGLRVPRTVLGVYVISGVAAAIGGIVLTGRLTSASPVADPNLVLAVIAGVLIGGTAFTGGDGGIFGTVLGVAFLGVIQNGLQLSDISSFWQGTVSGLILIGAVGLGVLGGHHRLRSTLQRLRDGVVREPRSAGDPAQEA